MGSTTSSDMVRLLRRHYLPEGRPAAGVLATEVPSPDGYRRADAIWAAATMSSGAHLTGHEIKVSRADVLVELADPTKADAWARYCDRWWLVIAHPSLIDGLDIPPHWGVMAPPSGRRTRSMTIVRDAPLLTPQHNAAAWRNIVAWQSYRAQEEAGAAAGKLAEAERERDILRAQLDAVDRAELRRQHPQAERVSEVLAALDRRNRERKSWVFREATADDIADALLDLSIARNAVDDARRQIEYASNAIADPLAHARKRLTEVLPKVGA